MLGIVSILTWDSCCLHHVGYDCPNLVAVVIIKGKR